MGGKMKPKLMIFFLLCCFVTSYARAQQFGYPCDGEGWYFIKIIHTKTSSTHNQTWKIAKVTVNGNSIRDFVVYQNGSEAFGAMIDGNLPFELKTRYSWIGKREYKFRIELLNSETGNPLSVEINVKSPPLKGYWNPEWKNYLTLNVVEESGHRRTKYPIHTTLGILSKYVRSMNEIRVVKAEKKGVEVAYTEIPFQVYDVTRWEDQELLQAEEIDEESGNPINRYHPTTTFSLCFLADLKPNEKASYLVFFNNSHNRS